VFYDSLPSPLPIPDGAPLGVSDTITIVDTATMKDLDVVLDITHTWVGDLVVTLTHEETGSSAILIDRPGVPAISGFGCSGADIDVTLDDEASSPVEDECADTAPTLSGSFTPNEALTVFDAENIAGTWTLHLSDDSAADLGTLNGWALIASLNGLAPAVTPTKDPFGDTDGDGCQDMQENGPNPSLGGRRDYLNFWDFFDVPAGEPPARNKIVTVGDIGAVVARFGAFRVPAPTEAQALAEALTPPAAMTGYHTSADRGGSIPGQNVWNLLPPDGQISVGDIGAVVAQFGHSCA